MFVTLDDVCEKGSSNLAQKDILDLDGDFPIFGAAGYIGNVNFYHQEKPYLAVVKDGAGVGRVMLLPAKSSVIGTMQYIIPKEGIIVEYLYYAVKAMHLEKYYMGAAIPHIYFKDYKKEKLMLCSKIKQEQIVARLDIIEKIINQHKQQLKNLEKFTKARFIEVFGESDKNTKQFPVRKLNEISSYWNGLTYKPVDTVEDGNGTLVLRSSNIQNGVLAFDDNVYVSCDIKEKLLVQDNDILMCSRNGSAALVGKTALIKGLVEPTTFGAFMMIIRSEYYSYLKTYFEMPFFRSQISTGTSTINQITGKMLNEISLPVPDIGTVKVFEEFVNRIAKSKAVIEKSLKELETLQASLMQKYFS